MKKIIVFITSAMFFLSGSNASAQAFSRKDVKVNLSEIHLDASIKQFKKASKANQSEILTELVRQANEVYVECETIEEVYNLRELMSLVQRYIDSAKQSFMSVQLSINTLNTKIAKTIREYEGGAVIIENRAGTYRDFGQELD